MKNIGRIRARSVEEVAKQRIKLWDGSDTRGMFNSYYYGDFEGNVEFYDDGETAHAKALRLEIEWLNKEEDKE